jgi:hypothetical protein
VAIGSGVVANSRTLTAFGIDRLIELASAGVLLWRLVGGRNRFARGCPVRDPRRPRGAWMGEDLLQPPP